jgi:hypothetical protein
MFADDDPVGFNAQIEASTHALETCPDAGARRAARELVRLVLEFHGLGLRRLLDIVNGGPSSLRQRIAEDPVIAALLALHDLEDPSGGREPGGEPRTADTPLIQIERVRRGPRE